MPSEDVVIKSLPAVRVAELTGKASGYISEEIGPVVQQLYRDLFGALGAITPSGPLIAYYEDGPAAATILHRGSMETVLSSYQALAKWVDAHGYRASGPAREYYLDCPADGDKWVTELQQPVLKA